MKPGPFLQRLLLTLAPHLYLGLERLLFGTCRISEFGGHHLAACAANGPQPYIAAFWHYSLLQVVHKSRERPYVAMVSGSSDGEFVARILALIGSKPVRGSRRKGGLGALRAMIGEMNNGFPAAIVADGSQGPPRKAQAGAILLSSRTGAPIVPLVTSANRFHTFRSWDRTVLPLPFARLALFWGEPLFVPSDLQAGDLERYRLQLEERLNGLYGKAWAHFGQQGHEKGQVKRWK